MESLTKQQIVLVTLLVSFVTSIATGIVTVALYDRAPKAVTQTINRIVERTVERVVSEPSKNVASPITTKETIVIREDDRVTDAVAKNTTSIARIKQITNGEQSFVSLGLIVDASGLVVSNLLLSTADSSFVALLSDGVTYKLLPVSSANQNSSFTFFRLQRPASSTVVFVPVTLVSGDAVKLGQSVVSISGDSRDIISTGLIQSLLQKEVNKPKDTATSTLPVETTKVTYALDTNIRDGMIGAPLLNLSGEVIGTRVPQFESTYVYATTDTLKKEIDSILSAEARKSTATSTSQTKTP